MSNKTLVVKFGGHAMSDEDGHFAASIMGALAQGLRVCVVHGGGPQINKALDAAGITSHFVGGFRVTTPRIFDVVEKVLAGEVGPGIAASLQHNGVTAIALSGRDSILYAERQTQLIDGSSADLGLVGLVKDVHPEKILQILGDGAVPVISPIASEIDAPCGLNVNADIAAAAIAGSIHADELIFMTDVAGIYRSWPDEDSLITSITASELELMKSTFAEGMAPKVQACLDAIHAGATKVRIIDGRHPQNFQLALQGIGGTVVIQ